MEISRGHNSPWLNEIFGGFLRDSIVDQKREIVGDHVIVFDYFVTAWKDSYYSRFRGRDAFLVDMSDEFYDFDPEIYANFRGVIRAYWSDVFRPQHVHFLPLGYGKFKPAEVGVIPASTEREYVWSFLGQVNKSSRPEMARALARVEPHLLFATDEVPGVVMWNRAPSGPRRYSTAENAAILKNSIFAPCPMGNANQECFRVYESLESGTIPILEKHFRFDYFRGMLGDHPLPTMASWNEASRWIRRMLENPAEINVLQRRCTDWWKTYKEKEVASLGEFMAERSAADGVASVNDIVLPKFSRPGWQMRELIKHHSMGALTRRVKMQVARVIRGRRSRVSINAGSTE